VVDVRIRAASTKSIRMLPARITRTLIDVVTDTIAIAIGQWAASPPGIGPRSDRGVGTKIVRIGHFVSVAITNGTSATVWIGTLVGALIGALIIGVVDPVAVVVRVGTAIVVLMIVAVFGHIGTAIGVVEHTVVVIVDVRAAVVVLETVPVLALRRAAIVRFFYPIVVIVERTRRVRHREQSSDRRDAGRGGERCTNARTHFNVSSTIDRISRTGEELTLRGRGRRALRRGRGLTWRCRQRTDDRNEPLRVQRNRQSL
jgi:hypothetical protein